MTATGTVEPTNQVEISSELSGIVRQVLVDYNDRVTAGQVLARLDTDKLQAEVAHCARDRWTPSGPQCSQAGATLAETQAGTTTAPGRWPRSTIPARPRSDAPRAG